MDYSHFWTSIVASYNVQIHVFMVITAPKLPVQQSRNVPSDKSATIQIGLHICVIY